MKIFKRLRYSSEAVNFANHKKLFYTKIFYTNFLSKHKAYRYSKHIDLSLLAAFSAMPCALIDVLYINFMIPNPLYHHQIH